MSYDLFFKREPEVSARELARYFSRRAHYQVSAKQAWYENEDTGVYFSFDLDTDPEDDEIEFDAAFNVNFARPSYFILEAEPEVMRFVRAFDFTVHDPQEVMADGVHGPDGLRAGWDHGNRSSFEFLAQESDVEVPASLPSATLLKAWAWNLKRQALQSTLGDDRYVPAVWFWRLGEEVITAALWPDGIPIAVPDVDYLTISRRELAPRKRFKRAEDLVFVAVRDAATIFDAYGVTTHDGARTLNYDSPPSDVIDFVSTLEPEKRRFERLAPDQVVDRELVK